MYDREWVFDESLRFTAGQDAGYSSVPLVWNLSDIDHLNGAHTLLFVQASQQTRVI